MQRVADRVPVPFWVLRHHSPTSVHSVAFANGGRLLIAGDADGRVSVTSLENYRPIVFWKAHQDSLLRADAWDNLIVTHGRDHSVKIWAMPDVSAAAPFASGSIGLDTAQSSADASLLDPKLLMSVGVNALNYCAYDIALMDTRHFDCAHLRGWIAVPNTLDSAHIDVYELPSRERVFEAVGQDVVITPGTERAAILMAVKLVLQRGKLLLLGGFEDGSVRLWSLDSRTRDYTLIWTHASHRESVMDIAVYPSRKHAASVGADDLLVRHTLSEDEEPDSAHATGHVGNGCVAVRADDRIAAVGGWDHACVHVVARNSRSGCASMRCPMAFRWLLCATTKRASTMSPSRCRSRRCMSSPKQAKAKATTTTTTHEWGIGRMGVSVAQSCVFLHAAAKTGAFRCGIPALRTTTCRHGALARAVGHGSTVIVSPAVPAPVKRGALMPETGSSPIFAS